MIAEMLDYKLVTGPREVEEPGDAVNPKPRMVPLHLARMSANVLLPLRGGQRGTMQFYCWVWMSGKHGGARLFRPFPGYVHLLFLREQGGYLHTVGDYPAYDLVIPRHWLPAIAAGMQEKGDQAPDLFERLVAVLIRTEFEGDATGIWPNNEPSSVEDLAGLTSPFYVASRLDSICRGSQNRIARLAACESTASLFAGRCEAYRLARDADPARQAPFNTDALARCEAGEAGAIAFFRAHNWPTSNVPFQYPWRDTPERHRLAMRLFASAMDPDFHAAACSAAAAMPEAKDIPECAQP
jgi:hypothetical protein